MIKVNNKRGQSETVGFVLIIIIVTIMILVYLYFMFRPQSTTATTSADMSNLLNALNEYTSNCTTTYVPDYLTGQELIQGCYNNEEQCLDGRNVCQALNETFKDVIGKTLDVNENSPIKSYKITINYYIRGSTSQNKTWYNLQEGNFVNCTERYGGYSIISESPGMLEVRLQVCRARNGE